MNKTEDSAMHGQHELWHTDHLNWISYINLWTHDVKNFERILEGVSIDLKAYTKRLDSFKNDISSEEFHIKQHESYVIEHMSGDILVEEHHLLNEKHGLQVEEFKELKNIYHQLNMIFNKFEKSIKKITEQ